MFLECIQLKEGQLSLLPYHQERINKTCFHFYQQIPKWDLDSSLIPEKLPKSGHYKVRLVYDLNHCQIEWMPYHFRPIQTLQVLEADTIDYAFKYQDRNALDLLFQKRGKADDIIIIKDGGVTDGYYANLAFLKKGQWFTPENPLLPGVKRAFLLDQGKLKTAQIRPADIFGFEKVAFINAMIDLEDQIWVDSKDVWF